MAVPILQSLLLADHVYRDQATGKHIICGVFSTIFFTPNSPQNLPFEENHAGKASDDEVGPSSGERLAGSSHRVEGDQPNRPQPIQHLMQAGSPYAYFSLTELSGQKMFEVRYVDLHDNRSLFQAEVSIECDDPLKTIEISLPLPRLPLVVLEERAYALEVLCEGQLLGSHRVLARATPGIAPPGI